MEQCSVCNRPAVDAEKCPKCKLVAYCSSKCRELDWNDMNHCVLCSSVPATGQRAVLHEQELKFLALCKEMAKDPDQFDHAPHAVFYTDFANTLQTMTKQSLDAIKGLPAVMSYTNAAPDKKEAKRLAVLKEKIDYLCKQYDSSSETLDHLQNKWAANGKTSEIMPDIGALAASEELRRCSIDRELNTPAFQELWPEGLNPYLDPIARAFPGLAEIVHVLCKRHRQQFILADLVEIQLAEAQQPSSVTVEEDFTAMKPGGKHARRRSDRIQWASAPPDATAPRVAGADAQSWGELIAMAADFVQDKERFIKPHYWFDRAVIHLMTKYFFGMMKKINPRGWVRYDGRHWVHDALPDPDTPGMTVDRFVKEWDEFNERHFGVMVCTDIVRYVVRAFSSFFFAIPTLALAKMFGYVSVVDLWGKLEAMNPLLRRRIIAVGNSRSAPVAKDLAELVEADILNTPIAVFSNGTRVPEGQIHLFGNEPIMLESTNKTQTIHDIYGILEDANGQGQANTPFADLFGAGSEGRQKAANFFDVMLHPPADVEGKPLGTYVLQLLVTVTDAGRDMRLLEYTVAKNTGGKRAGQLEATTDGFWHLISRFEAAKGVEEFAFRLKSAASPFHLAQTRYREIEVEGETISAIATNPEELKSLATQLIDRYREAPLSPSEFRHALPKGYLNRTVGLNGNTMAHLGDPDLHKLNTQLWDVRMRRALALGGVAIITYAAYSVYSLFNSTITNVTPATWARTAAFQTGMMVSRDTPGSIAFLATAHHAGFRVPTFAPVPIQDMGNAIGQTAELHISWQGAYFLAGLIPAGIQGIAKGIAYATGATATAGATKKTTLITFLKGFYLIFMLCVLMDFFVSFF